MTDIEKEALALVNEMAIEECEEVNLAPHKTLCAALRLSVLEHEDTKQEFDDFRQKVSDVVWDYYGGKHIPRTGMFAKFAIPKPDPLVAALEGVTFDHYAPNDAKTIRAALDKLGFEIKEKSK